LRYGAFKETALERVGFVSGEGRMIQTGGYKVRDNFSFGFALNDLFAGSNYTLGVLFEVVVNCIRRHPSTRGKTLTVEGLTAGQLPEIVSHFKEYI
jgi:FAD/FMN-containing dehydrogenase